MVSVFYEGDSLNYYDCKYHSPFPMLHTVQHPEPAGAGRECADATHHVEWDGHSIPSSSQIDLGVPLSVDEW